MKERFIKSESHPFGNEIVLSQIHFRQRRDQYCISFSVDCLHGDHDGVVAAGAFLRHHSSAKTPAFTGKHIPYGLATGISLASRPLFARKHQAEVGGGAFHTHAASAAFHRQA